MPTEAILSATKKFVKIDKPSWCILEQLVKNLTNNLKMGINKTKMVNILSARVSRLLTHLTPTVID